MEIVSTPTAAQLFVGRSREFAVMAERLQAARRGYGGLCVLAGVAGIGKSRLIQEFTRQSAPLVVAMHAGMAWEAGGAPAFWPWIQVLRTLIAEPEVQSAITRQPQRAAALAQLLPDWIPPGPGPVPLAPEYARFQLMDAVAAAIRKASERGPQLIVLEDLHAADPDSLLLLEFVAGQLQRASVLVLASWRPQEIERLLAPSTLGRLRRAATEVRLEALDQESVREYLRLAMGRNPPSSLVAELHELTEGHPMYLAEVVGLGLARGDFSAIPTTLTSTLLAHAAQLPPATRALLDKAAVLGREFDLDALCELAAASASVIEAALQPAFARGLLRRTDASAIRFDHALIREAIHDGIDPALRRLLHARRADAIERAAALAPGSDATLKQWAVHLTESGPAARARALDAWRRASEASTRRLAFDEAARCRAEVMALAGDSLTPAQRAADLIALAAAQICAGDFEQGRRNGREAFMLADTLDDPALLADAALTLGEIFTYAQVDAVLVQSLRRAHAKLPETDYERRPRVLARLAAALQPTPDPAEPIAIAREAIALARAHGSPSTVLTTLRSAISTLMDLGDPAERLRLNREYVDLATELGELSECMRGFGRMAIDALELGDPETLDFAIAQADLIAQRLALPHYQWSAAAFRAMRAIMRGEIEAAKAALADAARLARRAQDPNAETTLALQHLALADITEGRDRVMQLIAEIETRVAALPNRDLFLRPGLEALRIQHESDSKPAPVDTATLEAIIRFGDPGALCATGAWVAAGATPALAERIYAALLPRATYCGHWGIFGRVWSGPVAGPLALLATRLDRTEAAERHFDAAMAICDRLQARPWRARILLQRAQACAGRGDAGAARRWAQDALTLARSLALGAIAERAERVLQGDIPQPGLRARSATGQAVPRVEYLHLQRDGELWRGECDGVEFSLRDSRGLRMLARLVAEPGVEFHVLDLAGAPAEPDARIDVGDAGALLDSKARLAYRQRLEILRDEIEQAEEIGDHEQVAAARAEIEQLGAELSRAFGLDGRARRAGSAAERARVNVQRRLKDAIQRIRKIAPDAGRHLEWAVRTGTFCCYRPR